MSKEVTAVETAEATKRGKNIFKIPFENLREEPEFNSRLDYGDIEALAIQIKENGQKTPMVVSRVPKEEGLFYVRSGHRRFKAFSLLVEQGVEVGYVQAEIEEKGMTEEQRIIDMMLYNEGKPFSILEQGICFNSLKKLGYDVGDIQRKLGIKNSKTVYDALSLAAAPKTIQDAIAGGKISDSIVVKIVAENKKKWDVIQPIIDEAIENAAKDEKSSTKKATAKHVPGLKDKTPIQKIFEMVEKAEAKLDNYDAEKVALVKELAEMLKSKSKVSQLLALLK